MRSPPSPTPANSFATCAPPWGTTSAFEGIERIELEVL
jgi:hypothetical protein